MFKKIFTTRLAVIAGIILAAALFRLVPHWPNFTPVAAIALFGGTYLHKKYLAFLVPLTALFISDLILGFHPVMGWVYAGFTVTVGIGLLLRRNVTVLNIAGASLLSSVLFFLVTNFGAWLASPFYPDTFAGLIQCYVAGLAFFNNGSYGISFFLNEVAGSLFYNTILFGSLYLLGQRFPALAKG
ncbi:MAG TPA: hypothetical protein PKH94_09295 [Bacteroidales bacterium]|nr:hypothetical protein [Bacteroidales bacterium]HNS47421.1 hypothetical protein [Bacteroidales bacterium]